jgi:glutamyl-tRNA reductase
MVTSVSAAEHVLTRALVEQAMAARGNRALFLIDLGVPRNIDGSAGDLYNVYLYNIDNLTQIVEQNRRARESEIPRAEAIVGQHVAKFLSWRASVEAVALLEALRTKMQHERAAFIHDRLESMAHLSAGDRRRIEAIMDELVERLILNPAERIRSERELRRKIQNLEALRDFFELPRERP